MVEQSTELVLFNPHTDVKYLQLKEQAEELAGIAREAVVNDDKSLALASDNIGAVKDRLTLVQAALAEALDPLKQRTAQVNGAFALLIVPLNEANTTLRGKVGDYHTLLREQEAERQRIANLERELAEAKGEEPEPLPAPPTAAEERRTKAAAVSRGGHSTSGERFTWAFEIEDEERIPYEYMTPDLTKIGRAVRGTQGAVVIPGIRNVQQSTVVSGHRGA